MREMGCLSFTHGTCVSPCFTNTYLSTSVLVMDPILTLLTRLSCTDILCRPYLSINVQKLLLDRYGVHGWRADMPI
jgi:hypothetical protein